MQGRVVFAPLIRLDHRDHGIGSDESGDVIHVAVSVVAGDAAFEPDDGLRAKIIGEQFFIGRAAHGRVALLSGGEQAFLSRDESAAAVDIDRAAFEHDAVLSSALTYKERLHHASACCLRHPLPNSFVEFVIRIFGPRVEPEVQREQT